MRFLMMVRANQDTEAGVMPSDDALMAVMTNYNEEMAKAGVLLDGAGLQSSSKRARIKFSGGKATVRDGPFDSRELIAGYWLIQTKSRDEAIEWVKRCPAPHGKTAEAEIELGQLFELDDFAPSPAIDDARRLEQELANKKELPSI